MKGSTLAEVYLTTNQIKLSFVVDFTMVNIVFAVWRRSAKRAFPSETN